MLQLTEQEGDTQDVPAGIEGTILHADGHEKRLATTQDGRLRELVLAVAVALRRRNVGQRHQLSLRKVTRVTSLGHGRHGGHADGHVGDGQTSSRRELILGKVLPDQFIAVSAMFAGIVASVHLHLIDLQVLGLHNCNKFRQSELCGNHLTGKRILLSDRPSSMLRSTRRRRSRSSVKCETRLAR